MGCDTCPLKNSVEVPYRGNLNAEIIVIGESPGAQEIRQRQPFIGPSGQLLMEQLQFVGLDHENVFYANSARCQIDKDNLTGREIKSILSSCRPKLEIAIKDIKPKALILCGAIALEQITKLKGIKNKRGKWLWSDEFNCHIMPTWHPAYILRNQTELENFRTDLQKVSRLRLDGWEFDENDEFAYRESDTILPLLRGGFMRDDGTQRDIRGHRVIRTKDAESSRPFVTAIDSETQGLSWWDPNSIIISYSVAVNYREAWNIYLHEEVPIEEADFTIKVCRGGTKAKPTVSDIGIKRVIGYDRKVEELRELCARQDIKKYFANLKYEKHRFYNLGITELNNAPMDVMIGAHTLDSERFLNNTLSQLIDSFTNLKFNLKDSVNEAEKSDMLLTIRNKRDVVNKYACFDAIATLHVAHTIRNDLAKDEKALKYYVNFVHPTECDLLFEMERNGVLIDTNELPIVKKHIKQVMQDKVEEFKKLCPNQVVQRHNDNFKLTRRIILTDALFDFTATTVEGEEEVHNFGFHMQPVAISNKSRMPTCDKDALTQLLDSQRTPDRAKDLILAYREWSDHNTLLTRYVKNIEENIGPDNRIHPGYSIKFTSSGRTGARNPSIQNFPKRGPAAKLIRRLIIAPPGKVLMEVDHSMSELRWVAHVANERKMKEIFQNHGDIHLTTGLEVAGIRTKEQKAALSPERLKQVRQDSKAINFGFVYGMSAGGFKNYAMSSYHMKLTDAQAQDYRETYFRLYRDLPLWHTDCSSQIRNYGYIRTLFGRKRSLPNANSPDRAAVAEAVRVGTNVVIQGPSSDATLMGGNNILVDDRFIKEEASINIFIHDALIFEIDEDKVDKYAKIVRDCMENIDTKTYGFSLTVPLVVEAEYGKNLAEMTKLKF